MVSDRDRKGTGRRPNRPYYQPTGWHLPGARHTEYHIKHVNELLRQMFRLIHELDVMHGDEPLITREEMRTLKINRKRRDFKSRGLNYYYHRRKIR